MYIYHIEFFDIKRSTSHVKLSPVIIMGRNRQMWRPAIAPQASKPDVRPTVLNGQTVRSTVSPDLARHARKQQTLPRRSPTLACSETLEAAVTF
jgi:hypothetical protein